MPELLTPTEAAEILRTTPGALAALRYRGGGPKFHKLGRRVLYSPDALTEYVAANSFQGTADY
ncbi:helix-turn-helix domain-containing protein [Rhodococcus hoagii]|nr:helix-turn-helix domain-containing protein [Prescottella equi]